MIPVRTETVVDSIDVGEWLSVDMEEEPTDPEATDATAVFAVRIGDIVFRIRAPYLGEGAIEVLEAQRVSDLPRTKWPDLKNLRPQVVRLARRRKGDEPSDEPSDPESA